MLAGDWRPDYHLSRAAWLDRHAGTWAPLGHCLDGWRVSSNPASSGYDPRIERAPVYRLRHIEPMDLRTESEHWLSPLVADEPFCVQPGDVLVRRVGSVAAALVGERHRRHPIDGNLGIVRGLTPALALWAAYCLNQPHYRDYLESEPTIGALVRVGLRRIAEMPLAPQPAGMDLLALDWFQALDRDTQGLEQIYRLRQEVAQWSADLVPDLFAVADSPRDGARWAWFSPPDLEDQLNMALCEQRRAARALVESGLGVPIGALAQVSPRTPKAGAPAGCRVLRIGDLDRQFGYDERLPAWDAIGWRSQTRAVARFDVLVSTFAIEPKVAFVDRPTDDCVLPSEQLVTLCFHRHQGAYALLMESPLVQSQWARLATGTGQRFVQPGLVGRIVLPVPEEGLAADWHHRLAEVLAKRRDAKRRMRGMLDELGRLYRDRHPDDRAGQRELIG